MRTTFPSLLFVFAFALSALSRAIDGSPSGGSPTNISSSDGPSGSPYSRSRTIEGSSSSSTVTPNGGADSAYAVPYDKIFISEDYNGPAHAARRVTCWNCPEEAANGNYNLAQETESNSDLLCIYKSADGSSDTTCAYGLRTGTLDGGSDVDCPQNANSCKSYALP